MLMRWAEPFITIAFALAMLIAIPASGDGTVAAFAIATAVVVACIVTFSVTAKATATARMTILCALGGEDRHHRGVFRRQHAPNTPGRPGRPRSPGRALVGPVR